MFHWFNKHPLIPILGVFVLAFMLIGLPFIYVGYQTQQELVRIEARPVLTAAQVGQAALGTAAVIEGRISERNPLPFEGFVAYASARYEGQSCDDDGCEDIWITQQEVAPPLWLDLVDGRVQLADGTYAMQNYPVVWYTTDDWIEGETIRYSGFYIDSPVFVIGAVAPPGPEGPTFAADQLYGGDRLDYLADQQTTASVFFWVGLGLGAVSIILLIVILALIFS